MIKIKQLNTKFVPDKSLLTYSEQFIEWVKENEVISEKIFTIVNDRLVPAKEKLLLGIRNFRESVHTPKIKKANMRRDEVWRAIQHIIKANLKHPDKEFSEAARILKFLTGNYRRFDRKQYEEKSGAILNVIPKFRGEYKDAAAKIGLDFWVDELEGANNEFNTLNNLRNTEEAKKSSVDMKAVRRELRDLFRMLTNYLNGLVLLDGEEKYTAAFGKLNVIIDNFD